jgi:hypothetical protein
MGLTTPRYVLRYPVAADANNVPSDMLNLATDLDNKICGYSQGLLSARPAAAISGRVYYATDTGFSYRDTGAAWVIVSRPIADGSGVLAYNAAWPANPVDGQETDRYADASGTQIWRFRYRSADPGLFKWYLVGGMPLRVAGRTATYTTAGVATRMSLNDFAPGIAGSFRVTWSYLGGAPAGSGNLGLLQSQTGATVTTAVFNSSYVPLTGMSGGMIWAPWASGGGYAGDVSSQFDSWGYGSTPIFNTYINVNTGPMTGPLVVDSWFLPLHGGPWPPP